MNVYETVIGLEVHVELDTASKLFCGCATAFGAPPNTHTCPVCTGQPGALPVPNRRVLEHAVAVGLALNCDIARFCRFDRKNYFYPDNPQNYQISQLYLPICQNGWLELDLPSGRKRIRIHELHMEEDAGKLVHVEGEGVSVVDFNRAGVPLIEIVTEPDMSTAQEVTAFLEELRQTIRYLGASDCRMNEGSMRVDVNLSVKREGSPKPGTRTEMKNLNSFRAIAHAIAAEEDRQRKLLESGRPVIMETRRWDEDGGSSRAMRSKEDARDYRYFPEPDLPPIRLTEEWISRIRERQPELRPQRMRRYREQFGLTEEAAGIITASRPMAELFEQASELCKNPKKVSIWLMVETMRLLREKGMEPEEIPFSPEQLAGLVRLTDEGRITGTVAKLVFEEIFAHNVEPEDYVREKGLLRVADEAVLRETVLKVIEENPAAVADYRGGKKRAKGSLVGAAMKATGGQGDPAVINRLLDELLQ